MVNQNFIYAPQIIFLDGNNTEKPMPVSDVQPAVVKKTCRKKTEGPRTGQFYIYDPKKLERPNSCIFQIERGRNTLPGAQA